MVIKNENRNVLNILIGSWFLIGLIWITIPSAKEAMGIYLVLTTISYAVYRIPRLQKTLFGVGTKNLGRSMLWAFVLAGGFWLLTRFFPGFSLGLPQLPQSIGAGVMTFTILGIAPWIETFFVQGAFMGYLREQIRNRPILVITLQALFFAGLHIAAYVSGFYNYPSFTQGLDAIIANLGAFTAAFAFAWVAGYFVMRDGIKNLIFVGIFHTLLNLIIFTSFTVVFA